MLLLAAINTGIAAVLWVDDSRPFWQPLLTVQLYGFSIAYCVNAASPWEKPRPILRLLVAVAIGTLLGVSLSILVKGYSWDYVAARAPLFGWNIFTGFANGLGKEVGLAEAYLNTCACACAWARGSDSPSTCLRDSPRIRFRPTC